MGKRDSSPSSPYYAIMEPEPERERQRQEALKTVLRHCARTGAGIEDAENLCDMLGIDSPLVTQAAADFRSRVIHEPGCEATG